MAIKKTMFFLLLITSPVLMMAKWPAMRRDKYVSAIRLQDAADDTADTCTDRCGSPCCPLGWVKNGNNSYFIDDTPTPLQADARAACQSKGGDLAVIKSEEENKFIHDLIMKQSRVTIFGAWLGFERKEVDSDFYWVDDTPLEEGYTNWAPNKPNDLTQIEDCGNIYGNHASSGKWNDFPCDFTSGYQQQTKDDSPVVLCHKHVLGDQSVRNG